MATCTVYGTIINGKDQPVEGITINFMLAVMPSIQTSSGKAIYAGPVFCATDADGYFEKELIQSTEFIVIIASIGLKGNFVVPSATSYNLFELVAMYGTGDPAPGEPVPEPNW